MTRRDDKTWKKSQFVSGASAFPFTARAATRRAETMDSSDRRRLEERVARCDELLARPDLDWDDVGTPAWPWPIETMHMIGVPTPARQSAREFVEMEREHARTHLNPSIFVRLRGERDERARNLDREEGEISPPPIGETWTRDGQRTTPRATIVNDDAQHDGANVSRRQRKRVVRGFKRRARRADKKSWSCNSCLREEIDGELGACPGCGCERKLLSKGDWTCGNCSYRNFRANTACRRCGVSM